MKTRFEPLSFDQMSPEQRSLAERAVSGPRQKFGPTLNIFLRSPGIADPIEQLGSYVRFKSDIGGKYRELIILVIARHWTAQYPWSVHYFSSVKAGVPISVVESIAKGRRPTELDQVGLAVHDFGKNLIEGRNVSEAVFSVLREHFGERGIVELLGLIGYYSMLSMTLVLDGRAAVEGKNAPPLQPLGKE